MGVRDAFPPPGYTCWSAGLRRERSGDAVPSPGDTWGTKWRCNSRFVVKEAVGGLLFCEGARRGSEWATE